MKQTNQRAEERDQPPNNKQEKNGDHQGLENDKTDTSQPENAADQSNDSYTLEGGKKNAEGNNSTQGIP